MLVYALSVRIACLMVVAAVVDFAWLVVANSNVIESFLLHSLVVREVGAVSFEVATQIMHVALLRIRRLRTLTVGSASVGVVGAFLAIPLLDLLSRGVVDASVFHWCSC